MVSRILFSYSTQALKYYPHYFPTVSELDPEVANLKTLNKIQFAKNFRAYMQKEPLEPSYMAIEKFISILDAQQLRTELIHPSVLKKKLDIPSDNAIMF